MAVITELLPNADHVFGHKKASEYTRLVKSDIVRHGVTGWTQTVQKKRIPHNPKSAPQIALRCLVDFVSTHWWEVTEEEKSIWVEAAIAHEPYMGLYPYYLHQNLTRFIAFLGPERICGDHSYFTPIAIASHSFASGPGFATVVFTPAASTNIYGIVILRSLAEITDPSWRDAIKIIGTKTAEPVSYCDTPLRPGTYHYRAAAFTTDGAMGTVYPDFTVSVS